MSNPETTRRVRHRHAKREANRLRRRITGYAESEHRARLEMEAVARRCEADTIRMQMRLDEFAAVNPHVQAMIDLRARGFWARLWAGLRFAFTKKLLP